MGNSFFHEVTDSPGPVRCPLPHPGRTSPGPLFLARGAEREPLFPSSSHPCAMCVPAPVSPTSPHHPTPAPALNPTQLDVVQSPSMCSSPSHPNSGPEPPPGVFQSSPPCPFQNTPVSPLAPTPFHACPTDSGGSCSSVPRGGAARRAAGPGRPGGRSSPPRCLHPPPLPSRRRCPAAAPRPGPVPCGCSSALRVNAAPPPRGLPRPWTPATSSPAAKKGT